MKIKLKCPHCNKQLKQSPKDPLFYFCWYMGSNHRYTNNLNPNYIVESLEAYGMYKVVVENMRNSSIISYLNNEDGAEICKHHELKNLISLKNLTCTKLKTLLILS